MWYFNKAVGFSGSISSLTSPLGRDTSWDVLLTRPTKSRSKGGAWSCGVNNLEIFYADIVNEEGCLRLAKHALTY